MKESHGLISFVSKVGFCLSPKLLFQKLLRMWCCLTCVVIFVFWFFLTCQVEIPLVNSICRICMSQ